MLMTILATSALGLFAEDGTKTATFSMYCYWTGEATLGKVAGVKQTRIGHLGGSEIVEVTFDPSESSLQELVDSLKAQQSFYAVIARTEEEAHAAAAVVPKSEIERTERNPRFIESKYTLRTRHPELWKLGLTEEQAIALNSWSFFGGRMPDVLTARQKEALKSNGER